MGLPVEGRDKRLAVTIAALLLPFRKAMANRSLFTTEQEHALAHKDRM
jgi:hypothetical protein